MAFVIFYNLYEPSGGSGRRSTGNRTTVQPEEWSTKSRLACGFESHLGSSHFITHLLRGLVVINLCGGQMVKPRNFRAWDSVNAVGRLHGTEYYNGTLGEVLC